MTSKVLPYFSTLSPKMDSPYCVLLTREVLMFNIFSATLPSKSPITSPSSPPTFIPSYVPSMAPSHSPTTDCINFIVGTLCAEGSMLDIMILIDESSKSYILFILIFVRHGYSSSRGHCDLVRPRRAKKMT